MSYADYEYYTGSFLEGGSPKIPSGEFPRWVKLAGMEIDAATHGRLVNLAVIPDKVKDCACAIAELLYEADTQSEGYRSQGLAGPLASWSNDGQSGTIDLGQSVFTEDGRKAEVKRLCRLYLGSTGFLYAGVAHYES